MIINQLEDESEVKMPELKCSGLETTKARLNTLNEEMKMSSKVCYNYSTL